MNEQQVSLFSQLPGYWGCKDLNSVFVYANTAYAKLIGFNESQDCIGLTDFQMPSPTTRCAADFVKQDRYVIENNTALRILDIHPYPDGSWRAHIFTKTPWLDDAGEVQGTIFYGQELSDTAILEVGHWICRATGVSAEENLVADTLNATRFDHKLTNRESEALFLLLYGKKPHYIAKVMNISIKTLESYVARLRVKFGAHSKAQLIDMALEQGFGSHIPKTLLKTQISIALHNEYAA
ncbi:PAS domain-containing protein [Vibrio brasiliensis]|uniref:LuxR family transcriptional regulator n=1 Tax=Vibrio brasiliensis LMG 20546 TaxID=945543 RepID=E8LXI0_9VIBR|nr:helix-turn-helix transcriptional regulator [Vibrio brasiliensis]EGA64591.1 LuxR family transcriptional regulator [Vibrio brasiliensis LMG 20546]MCG9647774.1 PAS domain-containing protein [Vibrio brasiliensis]MCG9726569.1 PAS domain-containing protein [Vibrio brasiliensis]MCG9749569.1 PAS domain-containing protein [Vibrio brasiliensis]MCG9781819.1 PAS domain-containing protein [Vibrio brasiliensis]